MYIPRLKHVKGQKVATVAPICGEEGYTVYKCANSYCGCNFTADYVMSEDEHQKTKLIETVLPTCTESGYKTYLCGVCGAHYASDDTYTDRYNEGLGHEKGGFIKTVEPSCLNDGVGYDAYTCLHCSDEIRENEVNGEADHDYEPISYEEPSCINGGEGRTFKRCKLCDWETIDYSYDYGYEHDYELKRTVMPTCTDDGYDEYECTLCHGIYTKGNISSIGHVRGALVKASNETCGSPLYREYRCQICNETYKNIMTDWTDAPAHNYKNGVCTGCGSVEADVVESEHNYKSGTDKTWTITRPKADSLKLTFSGFTYTESSCDTITILDKNNKLVGEYSGNELAFKTVTVPGNTAKITLYTDSSANYYGFRVDKVVAVCNHTYTNKVTPATLKANGKIVKACSKCGVVASTSTVKYAKTVKLSSDELTYTGKEIKPSVSIKDSSGAKISSANYTLKYSNNKSVGKASVTVTFKGNYKGSKKLYFSINPKATKISKLSAGKKAFTVKWTKQSSHVGGYKIQYSTSSKFKKAKTVTVNGYKSASKTIKKLSAKKKYYVRIQTFKKVGKTTYVSSWSAKKSVKTK